MVRAFEWALVLSKVERHFFFHMMACITFQTYVNPFVFTGVARNAPNLILEVFHQTRWGISKRDQFLRGAWFHTTAVFIHAF